MQKAYMLNGGEGLEPGEGFAALPKEAIVEGCEAKQAVNVLRAQHIIIPASITCGLPNED